jgi:hypothetical protein
MNERIRTLMEEAGIYDFVVESMGIGEEMDKFAELIIGECLKISQKTCDELKGDESLQLPGFKTSMNLYNVTFRNSLTGHFGVEQ